MSNYVLTVVFNHKYEQGVTSQVYHLDSAQQVDFMYSKLCNDLSGYNISYSVACIEKDVLNAQQDS